MTPQELEKEIRVLRDAVSRLQQAQDHQKRRWRNLALISIGTAIVLNVAGIVIALIHSVGPSPIIVPTLELASVPLFLLFAAFVSA